MPRTLHRLAAPGAAALLLVATTGCACFNRGELVLARHISIGQELIDLQEARDRGAISQEEYDELRADLLEIVDSTAEAAAGTHRTTVHVTDEY